MFSIELFKKDYEKAMQWYNKAAEKGHPIAICNIGNMYAHGKGVEKDYEKAAQLLRQAAENVEYFKE